MIPIQLFGINEEVEQRLKDAQKNKSFKDAGARVGGSAKEKRAISALIKSSDLKNLEKDDATAIEVIVKDRVWPKLVPENELDNGVSSGCAFLKHAIRAAYAAKPQENTHQSRRAYIGFAEKLQQMLSKCYSVADVELLPKQISTWKGNDVAFLIEENILESYTEEDLNKRYSGYFLRITLDNAISRECGNIIFRQSEAGKKVWQKAALFEGVTAEQESQARQKHHDFYSDLVHRAQQEIIKYSTADTKTLRILKPGWRGVPTDLNEFRAKAIEFYTKKVNEFEKTLAEFPEEQKQREPDWSWTNTKKRSEKERPELIINQPPPLSFIKRTGGLEITKVSQQEIIDQFGFKYVEFGNSISDKEAREHVRHFLGALVDLFEVLNFNQKEINVIGDLSIAFASRGKKGSVASYNVNRRIININRRNGDGSVAHEWMHYLDHLMWQKFKWFDQPDQLKLASDKLDMLTSSETTYAFINLCKTIRNGDGSSKMVRTYFPANASHNYRGLMKEDVETTLNSLRGRYSYLFSDTYKNSARDAYRLFGFVAHHFNEKGIVVEREISRSSLFYYNSSQMSSDYWIKPYELLARAFETFIYDKLISLDRFNNYLVGSELHDHPLGIYPSGSERELFNLKFTEFFNALKKGLAIRSFVPFTDRRTEEYIVLTPEDDSTEEQHEEKIKIGVVVASDISDLLRLEISLFKAD